MYSAYNTLGAILKDYAKIDKELIKHISEISRIKLSESEMEEYAKELSDVLGAFKILGDIETPDEPAYHPIETMDRLREDIVKKTDWDPLSNAKSKEGKYFKGPKIV